MELFSIRIQRTFQLVSTNLQSVSEKLGEMEKYQGEMAMQSMFHR